MTKKVLTIIVLPLAVLFGFVILVFLMNAPKPDPYYDAMPVGSAQELIQKYADTYYTALDKRDAYNAAAKELNDKIEATKSLSAKYGKAFNAADDLVKKACEADESDASALFAEARQTKAGAEKIFAEYMAGNEACGKLMQAIRPQEADFENVKEELERAEKDYGIVICGCTRRLVTIDTAKVMAAEKEYVGKIRAKAASGSELAAACDRYDQAYTRLLQVMAESDRYYKTSSALSGESYKAHQKYERLKDNILTGQENADEAACRQAYAEWQAALKADRDLSEEHKPHNDDYSNASDAYKDAFHEVLYRARPAAK